jgi:hypothetical protein
MRDGDETSARYLNVKDDYLQELTSGNPLAPGSLILRWSLGSIDNDELHLGRFGLKL